MPADAPLKLSGADRAAILLLTLGEQEAAEVLKHLGPKEVQKLGATMAALSTITRQQVEEVLGDFLGAVDAHTSLGVGSGEYVRKVLTKALGEDKAGSLMDRILGGESRGLEELKWMDAKAILELIRFEHPQIIAIVLSFLEGDQSAQVLALFPEKVRADILLRIATLDGVQPAALEELNRVLEKKFSSTAGGIKSSTVGGIKAAASIVNFLAGSVGADIMAKVREADAALAEKIEDLMFVFEDLIEVDDRGIQTLLREVQSETLLLALKGADEAMKEKIFSNMSKRAAEMLRDDLEAKGPVKLSEVEAAQKEILTVTRRLSESGDIALGGKGGEEYV